MDAAFQSFPIYRQTELLYSNPLASPDDVKSFLMEGEAALSFPLGRLRIESVLDAALGQKANFVLWLRQSFPDGIAVSWDFWPIREPGLAMLFFSAGGQGGIDLFDSALKPREGIYNQYFDGDINAYHVSYFRRRNPDQKLNTCNLRKSRGLHLVAQGADPIPTVQDAKGPFRMQLLQYEGYVQFSVEDLVLFRWQDDGSIGGPALAGGKLGFRQMAPLIAEYANLTVHRITRM